MSYLTDGPKILSQSALMFHDHYLQARGDLRDISYLYTTGTLPNYIFINTQIYSKINLPYSLKLTLKEVSICSKDFALSHRILILDNTQLWSLKPSNVNLGDFILWSLNSRKSCQVKRRICFSKDIKITHGNNNLISIGKSIILGRLMSVL